MFTTGDGNIYREACITYCTGDRKCFRIFRSGSNRDFREMQEREMNRDIESLVVKKESSECSGLLPSIDHNITDAHTGYNVHREAFNEASVLSGDQFHEP